MLIDEIKAAYEQASVGSDAPEEIMMSTPGLKQFAEDCPSLAPEKRQELIDFARNRPEGSIIVMSRSGLRYVEISQ